MTNEQDPTPFSKKMSRRPRLKRQGENSNAAMADGPTKAPPLKPGPGRTRILDPDQPTLDENIKLLYRLAGIQATLEQAAAGLGVSLDTLREFFHRYPTVKERWDDYHLTGVASIHAQLFQNLSNDPTTARWMAERIAGIEDPYKRKELDLQELALARRQEEFEQSIELRNQELAQRERALMIKERQLELKISASRRPMDIRLMSPEERGQLLQSIREVKAIRSATINSAKQLPG